MVETNLPTEEKHNGQNYKVYNPGTDCVLVRPLPLYKQINGYVKQKTFQAAIWIIPSLIIFSSIFLDSVGKRHYLKIHIISLLGLFRGITAAIAAVLLNLGNKNENMNLLKIFSIFRFLSYTWCDIRAGNSKVVKKRMMEIMAKHSGNPDLAHTSHSDPVPNV